MSSWKEGDLVHVRPLNKRGTILQVLSGGRLRVVTDNLSITCRDEDVSLPKATGRSPSSVPLSAKIIPSSNARPPASLDLHGMSSEQAVRAVETHLNAVIIAGVEHTKIVHGLGTGRLQSAVHSLLSSLSVVRAYRINDRNPGETDVYL